jgi:hypothetical protein
MCSLWGCSTIDVSLENEAARLVDDPQSKDNHRREIPPRVKLICIRHPQESDDLTLRAAWAYLLAIKTLAVRSCIALNIF